MNYYHVHTPSKVVANKWQIKWKTKLTWPYKWILRINNIYCIGFILTHSSFINPLCTALETHIIRQKIEPRFHVFD